jgi:hypothetical protein
LLDRLPGEVAAEERPGAGNDERGKHNDVGGGKQRQAEASVVQPGHFALQPQPAEQHRAEQGGGRTRRARLPPAVSLLMTAIQPPVGCTASPAPK